jgi:hypothetical protein
MEEAGNHGQLLQTQRILHPNIKPWEGCACPGIAHRPAIGWLFSIHVVPMTANLYYSFATLMLGSASSDSGTGSGSRHTYQRGR